jgi:hypothetical protein
MDSHLVLLAAIGRFKQTRATPSVRGRKSNVLVALQRERSQDSFSSASPSRLERSEIAP